MVAGWLFCIGFGWWHISSYAATPGRATLGESTWPKDSGLSRNTQVPTILLILHPRCPCSRASLAEFARVLAYSPDHVQAYILFTIPEGTPSGWEKTGGLWQTAIAIPGVSVIGDYGGIETRRFGAQTSGQCYLFSPEAQRLFSGGITPSRGHEGANSGREILISLLTRANQTREQTAPVFGCSLLTTTSRSAYQQ